MPADPPEYPYLGGGLSRGADGSGRSGAGEWGPRRGSGAAPAARGAGTARCPTRDGERGRGARTAGGRPDPDTALEGTGILISDPSLSRVHARLEVNAQGVQIFDRGSSNGLGVDGKRVHHAWLSTMSRVRAG
ncbi:FHA domain-containing protein, partial [Streptomyces sp. NPDC055929]|uniref:FHA domain-containing protein n=1 Tax=Streptomyces sp. NPDC055929 TaxID=3345662 RepID=UPI0035E21985